MLQVEDLESGVLEQLEPLVLCVLEELEVLALEMKRTLLTILARYASRNWLYELISCEYLHSMSKASFWMLSTLP